MKVQELREIIRLIDQSSISEFIYENNGSTITIKKQTEIRTQSPSNNIYEPEETKETKEITQKSVVEKQVVTKETKEESTNESNEMVSEDITEIVSPMVGTFYRKPSPESDVYVDTGDEVTPDTIVCIVEAMKLFNEIEAETTGEIIEVLVGDGELVEYGQPLFKVKNK